MIGNHRTYRRFAARVLAFAHGLVVARRRGARALRGRPERTLANAPTLDAGKVVLLLVVALLSCSGSPDDDFEDRPVVGKVTQALTDTDSDGLDDDWETLHFGNLSQTASGDFDSDGMTNGEEFLHGFVPTLDDSYDDADGDRYPNVFEVRGSADPNDAGSTPTPTFVVNSAGGGTHTTIGAAITASNVSNGAYQIIAIAPGVYKGASNVHVTLASTKPKFLMIGLEGAGKTIIDGENANSGWNVYNSAVVASLTFQRTLTALYVDAQSKAIRFVDLLVRDNATTSYAGGVHVQWAGKVRIVGSTFLNNTGWSTSEQMWFGPGEIALKNTVVWGTSTRTMMAKNSSATLTTNHCLVKGQTLTGTGNLAGNVDPKFRSDGHLLWDSPLRSAGGSVAQSRIDFDEEPRPSSAPDIGADQFVDSDADELADQWELDEAGDLTTLTGRSQDADGDGLTNEEEYGALAKPLVADTDGDGLSDGDEVHLYGSSPLKTDTDEDEMPDAWEATHGISPVVANEYDDDDGDRYPNIFEYAYSSDPSDRQSIPTPTFVVNSAGGGTHTTIEAAINASNVSNGAYQIIGIAPGVYKGASNVHVTLASTKPKFLMIGLEGAGKTIIDGENANSGWNVYNSAVVASLTFQRTLTALYVDAQSKAMRFVDLLVRDNATTSYAGGVHVQWAGKVRIVGSTFLNNTGGATSEQMWFGPGEIVLENTVVWGTSTRTMMAKNSSATLTTNHCLVKGQTLTGTGNLAGNVDPKFRSDGHLLWDSPLRSAGGSVVQSRIDIDGELRPSSARDIGVDQFNDSDSDGLADQWELDEAGDLTTLTGRSQDADGDGLTNEEEYGSLAKPLVADTDGDGLSDGDEVHLYGSSPLKTDTDEDEMPDAWEATHGLSPVVANGYDDGDGDRYPNIFEYAYSSDPSDRQSIPTLTYVVNGAGGGTHTTIGAAIDASNVSNGAYQIIAMAPGVYKGATNVHVTLASTKPKLLMIGLEGAGATIIDGEGTNYGWNVYNSAVIASLTFRKTLLPIYIDAPSKEVRLVDLLVRDNSATGYAGGVHVQSVGKLRIVGNTFLDNTGRSESEQMWFAPAEIFLENTVVWGRSTGTMVAKHYSATLTAHHSLVKGQTLAGVSNLAGNTDPKLRSDIHIRSDSPLRSAGGSVKQSRIDIDGELRPSTTPDIGVDQFNDSDSDGLPDAWEIDVAGNLNTIDGGADEDGDGLSNADEYDIETNWLEPDTDKDGVNDGYEVAHGMNPLKPDADDMHLDLNGDGIIDSIGAQLGYQPDQLDNDGDSISNADEVLMCTDVVRGDSDGDGVPDATDAFPLDPLASSLVSDPQDVDAPTITLTSPWYAVEQ